MFAALSMVALVGQANKPACGLGNDPATGTPRVKCSVLFFAVDDLRSAMPPPALVPLSAFGCEFDRLTDQAPGNASLLRVQAGTGGIRVAARQVAQHRQVRLVGHGGVPHMTLQIDVTDVSIDSRHNM